MSSKIITRFAPSPTGDLHIGSLRSAFYAWLFARANKGKFILRIEDTDQARYQPGSEQGIFDVFEWVGLDFDETYKQSERKATHEKYAKTLIESGHAYRCFCTTERLEKMRQEQKDKQQVPKYDGACRNLSEKEVALRQAQGDKFVIRLKIPETGETKVQDIIRGEIKVKNEELDDFVILKSDGFPTYHLAHIVDDHGSGVTHVIRGEEWLPSLPKHKLIYQALGWDLPQFAHLPMVLAKDKSKLSKRHGAVGVKEFKQLGYLPEALLNYVLLLGWHPQKGSEQEIFTLPEMMQQFKLEDVQKSGAVFDYQKLDSINSIYIRQTPTNKLAELAWPFFEKADPPFNPPLAREGIEKAIELEKERITKLSDLPEALRFIFEDIDYDPEVLVWRKSDRKTALERLKWLQGLVNDIAEDKWQQKHLEKKIKDGIEKQDLGTGDTLWPMRTALSGQKNSPGPFEIAEVLGKNETIMRLNKAIEKLNNHK
jgi:glutamyl-tRNA synthetase